MHKQRCRRKSNANHPRSVVCRSRLISVAAATTVSPPPKKKKKKKTERATHHHLQLACCGCPPELRILVVSLDAIRSSWRPSVSTHFHCAIPPIAPAIVGIARNSYIRVCKMIPSLPAASSRLLLLRLKRGAETSVSI